MVKFASYSTFVSIDKSAVRSTIMYLKLAISYSGIITKNVDFERTIETRWRILKKGTDPVIRGCKGSRAGVDY